MQALQENQPDKSTMTDHPVKSSKRVLEPISRVSEVLFGIIMVLTITGSLSVAEAGRGEIRTMLIGALGCNLAWGLIDGVLYLMAGIAEKGTGLRALHAVRKATDPQRAQQTIADALPPLIAFILTPAELETMRQRLKALPEPPDRPGPGKEDWLGALGVFLLVFLSTFPVVIPFTFMQNTLLALRISNAIAIVMLFMTGYVYGRITRYHPWVMGVAMVVLGLVLVGMAMALGG
jgi:VIT family